MNIRRATLLLAFALAHLVWVPRATGSEGGPMLLTGDPATTEVTVPEPGMLGLLTMGALGLMGVIVFHRRHPAT